MSSKSQKSDGESCVDEESFFPAMNDDDADPAVSLQTLKKRKKNKDIIDRGKTVYFTVRMKHCKENMWLVKSADLNQGRGIEIFKKLQDIETF